MESTNLYHLQHQPQAVDTSLATPSSYGIGSARSWSPQISSNAGNLNQILQEAASRSRDATLNSCMIQDLGYHQWGSSDAESWLIKEEMCDTFPKFTEMPNNSASAREQHYRGLQEEKDHLNGVSEKLLLNTLSSSDFYSPTAGGLGAPSRGNFSQIHPTINISSLNHSSRAISTTSSDMNLHSLYPLSLPRFSGDSSLSLHMRHPVDRSSTYKSSIPSHFTNAMIETKRSSALMKSKPSQSQSASKRLRPESRSSCPPLKVRKEKLGDRIAALQQLVAPFGKTDTASVLMEAVGYIKFLQNQVETLIVPYMKSSPNQNNRVMQGGSGKGVAWDTPKRDLISRGLCLVPLSCISYITGDHGSTGVWHHPSFDGPS